MTETDKPITEEQLNELTLRLGKALSILELFVPDMRLPEANGGIVAQDLINEAIAIAYGWAGFDFSKIPGEAS